MQFAILSKLMLAVMHAAVLVVVLAVVQVFSTVIVMNIYQYVSADNCLGK